eukprot:CAMPEP_0182953382 /NCGR_PEP_ID=MMETSP0105_2-20130417/62246_1 /TAXON_ID=81532 ORGANISM="Acanthoeca-like sp., Strain 10tr" /NCGR_SAMPLE_ID=MMETSP0105_2 /ASSEMBLY_ACC=CAM_ASM_000205 /LENGTH=83 /DNA_ID=CAMNT_0025093703 /DNA_START=1034 /DNA_END=1285 /DNA_ORIENTATION=-
MSEAPQSNNGRKRRCFQAAGGGKEHALVNTVTAFCKVHLVGMLEQCAVAFDEVSWGTAAICVPKGLKQRIGANHKRVLAAKLQ